MNNKDLDNVFKDALHQREVVPPNDLWDRIETELHRENNTHSIKGKRVKKFVWAPYAVAASLLMALGTGLLIWQENGSHQDKESLIASDTPPLKKPTKAHRIDEISKLGNTEHEQIKSIYQSEKQHVPPSEKPLKQSKSPENLRLAQKTSVTAKGRGQSTSSQATVYDHHTTVGAVKSDVSIEIATVTTIAPTKKLIYVDVTDVDPVKPLVESFEEDDDGKMFASDTKDAKENILRSVKTLVTDNISALTGREVNIGTDNEGSLRIDLGSSLVRNKKRNRNR